MNIGQIGTLACQLIHSAKKDSDKGNIFCVQQLLSTFPYSRATHQVCTALKPHQVHFQAISPTLAMATVQLLSGK